MAFANEPHVLPFDAGLVLATRENRFQTITVFLAFARYHAGKPSVRKFVSAAKFQIAVGPLNDGQTALREAC